MNTAIELTKPVDMGRVEGKGKAKRDGANAKFERALDDVEPSEGKAPGEKSESAPRGKRLRKRLKHRRPDLRSNEDKLAALVDAVASRLNKALGETTKGHVKPEGKQHVEQAFAQRAKGQKPLASLFAKLHKKVTEEDGEQARPKTSALEKTEVPEARRILSPREPVGILTTKSTPIEVRLAATVQSTRPTVAVAPTNQYVQIQPTQDGGAAQIRLDLGNGTHLDVALDVRDGVARVQLRSNGAEVTNRMSLAADELVKALQDAGIDAAEVDIEWDEPEADDPDRNQQPDDQDDDVDESDGEKFTSFVHIVT